MTQPVHGKITAKFDQPRPLEGRTEENAHVHGAVDITARLGVPICAPENGYVRGWIATRYPGKEKYWPENVFLDGTIFPFANYFYDMYGGILVLRTPNNERTHVIAHCWGNQIINKPPLKDRGIHWKEQRADSRWPIHACYTDELYVGEGVVIGYVGNAGYSTGPHIHWEIHNGYRWQPHAKRIDPLST